MENSESQSEIAKFECPYCHKKFNNIVLMKRHIFRTHFKYDYSCPYCNVSFISFRQLQNHFIFKPDNYHQNFYHLITKRHLKFVAKNLFYVDNSDVKNDRQKSIADFSTSKYNYGCPFCEHIDENIDNLYYHIMLDHNVIFIKCPYCEFLAIDFTDLRNHSINQKDYQHQNLYKLLIGQYRDETTKLFFMKK